MTNNDIQKNFHNNIIYFFFVSHFIILLVSMLCTSRMVHVFGMDFTGGLFLIPFTFFIQDIVTESYGYKIAKNLLNNTIGMYVLFVAIIFILSLLQKQFKIIIGDIFRHSISVIFAIYLGGLINNIILYNLKLFFNKRFLAMRFIVSTAIGEAVFQIIATFISWYGIMNNNKIIILAIIAYLYKILFEIFMTLHSACRK